MAFNAKDWEEQKEESNIAVTLFILFIIYHVIKFILF
jgi:hypothetical protein